jgi:hypothetical protein
MIGKTHVEAVFAIFTEADQADYKFADRLLEQGIGCREDARELVNQWAMLEYPGSVTTNKKGKAILAQDSAGIKARTRVLDRCFPKPPKVKAEPVIKPINETVDTEENETVRGKADKVFKLLVEFSKLTVTEQIRFLDSIKSNPVEA